MRRGLLIMLPTYLFFRWFSVGSFIIYELLQAVKDLIQYLFNCYRSEQIEIFRVQMKEEQGEEGDPLAQQLHILKNKLQQRGSMIRRLSAELETQKATSLALIALFQQREDSILKRLRTLQAINSQYIKDYLLVKQKLEIEEPSTILSLIDCSHQEFLISQYHKTKQQLQKAQQNLVGELTTDNSIVANCTVLIKDFLVSQHSHYNKVVTELGEDSHLRLKGLKGLQKYHQQKEAEKSLKAIRDKIEQLAYSLIRIDQKNVVDVFNKRKEIERQLLRLDASKGQPSAKNQQQMLRKIIEEIVMLNAQPGSAQQKITEYFLVGEFNSFYHSIMQRTQHQRSTFIEGVTQPTNNLAPAVEPTCNLNELTLSESINQQEDLPLITLKKGRSQQRLNGRFNKLQIAFQTGFNRSFFRQQERSRDELIKGQNNQIQEHEKVINKLITFIKKEFSDKSMDEIQGEDPEQLMGYYFRVNEKKYVDIHSEMDQLQVERRKIEEENYSLRNQKQSAIRDYQQTHAENIQLKEAISQLQKQRNFYQQESDQLKEIKLGLEEEAAKTKNQWVAKVTFIQAENQDLKMKLELQRLQILALSDIYEGSKHKTITIHDLASRTENIVKLSLETLFSTCLNKLTPQELIQRLQNIIELIRVNMKLKNDLTFQLQVKDYLSQEQDQVKRNFSLKVNEDIVPYTNARDSPLRRQQQREIIQGREDLSDKTRSFAEDLEDLAFEIIDNSYPKEDNSQEEQRQPFTKQLQVQQRSPKLPDGISPDFLLPLLSLLQGKKQVLDRNELNLEGQNLLQGEDEKNKLKGFDKSFVDDLIDRIREIKESHYSQDEDLKEIYGKYKQALSCLQRSEKINKEYQMGYQQFLRDLKTKGALPSPQTMENKLFYMQRLIATQNELLEGQRKEFDQTIMKQVQKSESLAAEIVSNMKLHPRKGKKS